MKERVLGKPRYEFYWRHSKSEVVAIVDRLGFSYHVWSRAVPPGDVLTVHVRRSSSTSEERLRMKVLGHVSRSRMQAILPKGKHLAPGIWHEVHAD
mgnify:CR=1 FL=1